MQHSGKIHLQLGIWTQCMFSRMSWKQQESSGKVFGEKKTKNTNKTKTPPDSKSRQKIAKIGRSDACPIASREQRGSLVNEWIWRIWPWLLGEDCSATVLGGKMDRIKWVWKNKAKTGPLHRGTQGLLNVSRCFPISSRQINDRRQQERKWPDVICNRKISYEECIVGFKMYHRYQKGLLKGTVIELGDGSRSLGLVRNNWVDALRQQSVWPYWSDRCICSPSYLYRCFFSIKHQFNFRSMESS